MGCAGSKPTGAAKKQLAAEDADGAAEANESLLPPSQKLPKDKDRSAIRRVVLQTDVPESYNPEEEAENEASSSEDKTEEELGQIRQGLERNELFASATEEQVSFLLKGFTSTEVQLSELIIVRGEPGDHFYIVGSGKFEVRDAKGVVRQTYEAGDSFGDLALLYNAPRAANVTCTAKGVLWALESRRFRYVMAQTGANVSSADAFLKSGPDAD